MKDDRLISLNAALDVLHGYFDGMLETDTVCPKDLYNEIEALPSAQPEIIRCKDCKYRDENWRRVSVRWLPCMDVRTGSNWHCGSAERGEQHG